MRLLPSAALCVGLVGLGALIPPVEAQTTETVISSGTFRDADQSHRGAGTARFLLTDGGTVLLQFTDFTVTPGPDLEVWLVDGTVPTTNAAVLAHEYLSLGPLQSASGDQMYELPSGPLAEDYDAVVIWCEDFGVLFAVAAMR